MSRLGWYIGWERYSWASTLMIGIGVAAAVAQLRLPSEARASWMLSAPDASPTAVQHSDEMQVIAEFMLITAGTNAQAQQTPPASRSHPWAASHWGTFFTVLLRLLRVLWLCVALCAVCCCVDWPPLRCVVSLVPQVSI